MKDPTAETIKRSTNLLPTSVRETLQAGLREFDNNIIARREAQALVAVSRPPTTVDIAETKMSNDTGSTSNLAQSAAIASGSPNGGGGGSTPLPTLGLRAVFNGAPTDITVYGYVT